jgi:hypothetical protein
MPPLTTERVPFLSSSMGRRAAAFIDVKRGFGVDGSFGGRFLPNEWVRWVVTVDTGRNRVSFYQNGARVAMFSSPEVEDNGAFALDNSFTLFESDVLDEMSGFCVRVRAP